MPYLVALLIFGLSLLGVGTERWIAGRKHERQIQQAMIARMVADAAVAKAEADARTASLEEQWRAQRQGADRAQETERARTRAALAAVSADRDRLRVELASVASGGVEAGADSVPACRDRADALGRVLGEALQAHAQCTADAEDLAAGVRALREAWPRD